MLRLRFDDIDYSVVVKNRGSPSNSWRWEIYRAGRWNPVEQSPVFFRSMVTANKAGKAALKQLLASSTPNPVDEKCGPISRHGFWKVSVTGAPRSEAGRAGWAAPCRRPWDYPRLHR